MEDKEKEFFENLIKAEVENTVKISMNTQLMPKIEELKNHSYYNKIEKYVSAWCTRNLFRYTLQQKNQKDKKLASRFIDELFEFLDSNFPCWKNNEIWKKRSFLKRVIEGNKTLTKIYCKAF